MRTRPFRGYEAELNTCLFGFWRMGGPSITLSLQKFTKKQAIKRHYLAKERPHAAFSQPSCLKKRTLGRTANP